MDLAWDLVAHKVPNGRSDTEERFAWFEGELAQRLPAYGAPARSEGVVVDVVRNSHKSTLVRTVRVGAGHRERQLVVSVLASWHCHPMTATDALRAALRDVVSPAARAAGFKGSGNTWRRTNPVGDVAVVNVQSSTYSSAASARCVINIAVAPAPWLDLAAAHRGRPLKSVSHAEGLFRDRVHPSGTPPLTDGWWLISSPGDADAAAHDMVDQLSSQAGFPLLVDLLNRDRFLEVVRAGNLGFRKKAELDPAYGEWFFSRAEAVLLADQGPSARLDQLLDLPGQLASPAEQETGFNFASWIRSRAQRSIATTRQN